MIQLFLCWNESRFIGLPGNMLGPRRPCSSILFQAHTANEGPVPKAKPAQRRRKKICKGKKTQNEWKETDQEAPEMHWDEKWFFFYFFLKFQNCFQCTGQSVLVHRRKHVGFVGRQTRFVTLSSPTLKRWFWLFEPQLPYAETREHE